MTFLSFLNHREMENSGERKPDTEQIPNEGVSDDLFGTPEELSDEEAEIVFLAELKEKNPDLAVIIIDYDGSGDSGSLETIYLYTKDRYEREPFSEGPDETCSPIYNSFGGTIRDASSNIGEKFIYTERHLSQITEFALEQLSSYGGWEIDDGSFGIIIIDLDNDEVRIEHSWRVSSTEEENSTSSIQLKSVMDKRDRASRSLSQVTSTDVLKKITEAKQDQLSETKQQENGTI